MNKPSDYISNYERVDRAEQYLKEVKTKIGGTIIMLTYNSVIAGATLFASGYALANDDKNYSFVFAAFAGLGAAGFCKRLSDYLKLTREEANLEQQIRDVKETPEYKTVDSMFQNVDST